MRKNIQSTKLKPSSTKPPTHDTSPFSDSHDAFPPSDSPNQRVFEIHARCLDITGKAYSDLTGEFVIPSSRGNKYILVFYDYDSNHIFAEPLKSRSASHLLDAHKSLLATLATAGLSPKLLVLDNECPSLLKDYLKSINLPFQLVPPHQHQRNAAERAIRTWKNHFLAILCSTDDGFPLHLWDHLVPQANITLNLLRGSRINPRLSSWAQVYGVFDYNRTPLAPPGTRVLAHEPSTVRKTWARHALEGWYVGPALESYRCFKIWIEATRHIRIIKKCTWFPSKVHLPVPTTSNAISMALHDLAQALKHPDLPALLPTLTSDQQQALLELDTILSNRDGTAMASLDDSEPPLHPGTSPRVPSLRRSPRLAQANYLALSANPSWASNLCFKAIHPDTGKLTEYKDLRTSSEGARWELACAREWARLMKGLPSVDVPTGRDTFTFISKNSIPPDRKITYL